VRWILIAFGALACNVAGERQIPFPPKEGARSLVLAIEIHGRIESAEALSLDPPAVARVGRLLDDGATLHALVYRESLDALGFDPGSIEEATGVDAHVLPAAQDHYVARLAALDTGWLPMPDPGALSEFYARYRWVDPYARCDAFSVSHLPLPTEANWDASVPIDGGSVLLLTSDDEQFVLTATSVRSVEVRAPRMRPLGVTKAGDTLFYAAAGGIWRGAFDGANAIDATPFVSIPANPRWIAARTEPTVEIVTLDAGGAVFAVTSSGATLIDRIDLSATSGFDIAGVAMGDGDALVVADALFDEAIVVRDGAATRERHAFDGVASLLSATFIAGYGYVAGTSNGQIARRGLDGRWEALPETGFALNVRTVEPFGDGLVYAGANGGFGQLVFEQDRFCEVTFPVTGTMRGAHALGDRIMLIQKILENQVAILETNRGP
jgi:hypothetical protein